MLKMCCFMFLIIDFARNELPYASRGSEHTSAREHPRKTNTSCGGRVPTRSQTYQTADAQGHCTVQCVSPQLCQELGPEKCGSIRSWVLIGPEGQATHRKRCLVDQVPPLALALFLLGVSCKSSACSLASLISLSFASAGVRISADGDWQITDVALTANTTPDLPSWFALHLSTGKETSTQSQIKYLA